MTSDKNKTGGTPQNDASERGGRSKTDAENVGSPKPGKGSGKMNQRGGRDRAEGGPFTNEPDPGSPEGEARIDDDDDEDMGYRPDKSMGTPRNR